MKIVRISRAALDDVQDLKKLELACGLSPWSLESYMSEIVRDDCAAFIARDADRTPVGFIIGRIPTDSGGAAEVFNIGVLSEARRKGVGKSLLLEFIEESRRRKASEIWLEARTSNAEAIRFYQASGFEAGGIRPNFYENPTEDAQMMTLKLGSDSHLTK